MWTRGAFVQPAMLGRSPRFHKPAGPQESLGAVQHGQSPSNLGHLSDTWATCETAGSLGLAGAPSVLSVRRPLTQPLLSFGSLLRPVCPQGAQVAPTGQIAPERLAGAHKDT